MSRLSTQHGITPACLQAQLNGLQQLAILCHSNASASAELYSEGHMQARLQKFLQCCIISMLHYQRLDIA